MVKNNCVYLLYKIGKSAMQSGLVKKDLWALVPKNSKGAEFASVVFNRQSQGVLHFETKEAAVEFCTKKGFEFFEMPSTDSKKLRLKSYTNTINGIQD